MLARAAVVSGWVGGAAGFGFGLGFHGEGDAVAREMKGMVAPSARSLAVAATEAGRMPVSRAMRSRWACQDEEGAGSDMGNGGGVLCPAWVGMQAV